MTPIFEWLVEVEVDDLVQNEQGLFFEDVIREVNWRCTIKDTETNSTRSMVGTVLLPIPESQENYIDLSTIINMESDEKRSTVIGWAELIQPGFIANTQQTLTNQLQNEIDKPKKRKINLL